ncbi:MAG: reverse transcriptase domain-containing protein [Candidatus Thiodiazotropha sp.]
MKVIWVQWVVMVRPNDQFRYADDAVCHCKSEAQAEFLKRVLIDRLMEVGLELHLEKTRIVYCQDENRKQLYSSIGFDILGYTFRACRSKNRYGSYFANFSPAISKKAEKSLRQEIR